MMRETASAASSPASVDAEIQQALQALGSTSPTKYPVPINRHGQPRRHHHDTPTSKIWIDMCNRRIADDAERHRRSNRQGRPQWKVGAYAADVVTQHPAQKTCFIHNKTPRDQSLADEVYSALRKSGKDALLYDSFSAGDIAEIQKKDLRSVEQADVLFCGCTAAEANAVKATAAKQGFTSQFVVL